ncbi:hypothetical protein OXX69_012599, partial [Metschnikowia pulcherrima]
FINLDFKTELVTQIKKINRGVTVKIDATVQYQKKPGKFHVVKFQHGSAPMNSDTYKSGTVTVQQGLSPNSKNPKRPRGVSSAVDYSKYYNRGVRRSNGGGQSAAAPAPAARNTGAPQPYMPPQPAALSTAQTPARVINNNVAAPVAPQRPQGHSKPAPMAPSRPQPHQNSQPARVVPPARPVQKNPAPAPPARKVAPPPPPPPPALAVAKPKHPTYKVLYDYDGSVSGSVPLVKEDVVYVVSVNGKWGLVKDLKETREGWAPLDYMKEIEPPADLFGGAKVAAPAPPPPPPAHNSGAQKQPQASAQPQSSTSVQTGGLGNGLADALKAKKTE